MRSRLGVWVAALGCMAFSVSVRANAESGECSRWLELGRTEQTQAEASRDRGGIGEDVQDHLEKARDAFARAAEDCPDSARASWNEVESRLGYVHHRAKHWNDACEVYAKLLEADPDRPLDRALYADALQEAGRFDEALSQLQKLLDAQPEKGAVLYCNIAMLYALDLQDGPRAIETAQKGLAAHGPEPCLTYAWGIGLELSGVDMLKTGDTDRGLHLLQEAKLKFTGLSDDPEFGATSNQDIDRVGRLIDQGEHSGKTREKR